MTHRYIPGMNPLAPQPYTQAERDDLVRRVQAMTSAGMLNSIRGSVRYWAKYREAKDSTENPPTPTTPARVAVRLVELTGWSFATAAWALTDVTRRHLSQHVVRRQWHRMLPAEQEAGRTEGSAGRRYAASTGAEQGIANHAAGERPETERRDRVQNLVQQLIHDEPKRWLDVLTEDLKIDAVRDGDLVSLKYNQIESPMHELIVQQCRGMVVDVGSRHVIAWPYNKFWNHGEALAAPVDWATARVQEKLDGSLMILHWHHGWRVASSGHPTAGGSFGDEARTFRDAFWWTWDALGHQLPPDEMRDTTFMFELCDQPNRIVVKHDHPRIVLHGARRLTDGRESAYGWLCYAAEQMRCEVVQCLPYTSFSACDAAVQALDPLKCEGFVVVDDQFNRVKIKSPRYVALHHLKGNATPRRAIELWQAGEHEELLAHFPEFRPVIEPVHDKLDQIARRAFDEHEEAMCRSVDRKGYAAMATRYPFSAVMFRMLTNGRASVDEAKAIMRGMSLAALERMVES